MNMSFPKLCLNCFKNINETIVLACEACERFQFPEKILCDVARLNAGHDSFECNSFKPKFSLVQKVAKAEAESDPIQEFGRTKTEREKWIVSYIVQQHKLNPDQVQFKLKYHLVLITNNRIALFSDKYFQTFSEIFNRVGNSFQDTDIEVIWLASDHLHLYLNTSPDYSIDEITQSIIKKSEFEIINRIPDFQKDTNNIWKYDYFVETVG